MHTKNVFFFECMAT